VAKVSAIASYTKAKDQGETTLQSPEIKQIGEELMMKRTMACLFIASVLLCITTNLNAKLKLTEEEAQKELLARIEKDKRYGLQVHQSCLTVFSEGGSSKHFGFSIHVNQGGNCPGNPNATPIVEYFQVNRATGKVEVKNPHSGRAAPLPNQTKKK
jgi:hypothetical protein